MIMNQEEIAVYIAQGTGWINRRLIDRSVSIFGMASAKKQFQCAER